MVITEIRLKGLKEIAEHFVRLFLFAVIVHDEFIKTCLDYLIFIPIICFFQQAHSRRQLSSFLYPQTRVPTALLLK